MLPVDQVDILQHFVPTEQEVAYSHAMHKIEIFKNAISLDRWSYSTPILTRAKAWKFFLKKTSFYMR